MIGANCRSSSGLFWRPRSDKPRTGGTETEWNLRDGGRIEETPDGVLVRLAREGSLPACDALVRRYQDRVYTIALRYLNDPEEALDLSQEVFMRMVEALHRFREQANFYTWLYRITVNCCIDRRRRASQRPSPTSLEEFESDREAQLTETRTAFSPQAALEARELREQLGTAIAAVPEPFRMVVILADIEGLAYGEIAQILGCPVNTVRTRLHRGRLAIRQRLEPYLNGAEEPQASCGV